MKKLIIILVVILVCILAVGGVLIFMGTMNQKPQQETTVTDTTAVQTSAATETALPETQETEPTETVVVTTAKETQEETTTATTAPTTEPTEATEGKNTLPDVKKEHADGTVTGSGSFTSSTGASLDVQVNWQTFKDSNGNRKVCLDISLNCCNLYVGDRNNGLTITLGDTTKTLDTDAIDYTGSSTNILIGSIVMDMPESATNCSVTWAFRGSYNQTKIDNITATGSIG